MPLRWSLGASDNNTAKVRYVRKGSLVITTKQGYAMLKFGENEDQTMKHSAARAKAQKTLLEHTA